MHTQMLQAFQKAGLPVMTSDVLGTDPRAHSAEKLGAPHPLPFISRRCLARVKDRIEPPTECPHCSGTVALVNNAEIYGRSYGDWPYAYWCEDCDAYVGLHPKTDLPLGTLATPAMREARKQAKSVFMVMVDQRFKGDGNKAYRWLAEKMGIESSACHFGMFTLEQANEAGEILRKVW